MAHKQRTDTRIPLNKEFFSVGHLLKCLATVEIVNLGMVDLLVGEVKLNVHSSGADQYTIYLNVDLLIVLCR